MVFWNWVQESMLRRLATVLFVLSIPLLLITSNVRWAANEPRLYEYSFDHYDAEARTGVARNELDFAGRDLIRYFNDDRPTIQTLVTQDGRPRPLYNERETSHLRDVKDLFRTVFRVQEASLAFALVYVVGVFVWARRGAPAFAGACRARGLCPDLRPVGPGCRRRPGGLRRTLDQVPSPGLHQRPLEAGP